LRKIPLTSTDQKVELRSYIASTTTGNCRQLKEDVGTGVLFGSSLKNKEEEKEYDEIMAMSLSSHSLSPLSRNINLYC